MNQFNNSTPCFTFPQPLSENMLHSVPITNEYYTPNPTKAFFVRYGIATRGFKLDLFEIILHHTDVRCHNIGKWKVKLSLAVWFKCDFISDKLERFKYKMFTRLPLHCNFHRFWMGYKLVSRVLKKMYTVNFRSYCCKSIDIIKNTWINYFSFLHISTSAHQQLL